MAAKTSKKDLLLKKIFLKRLTKYLVFNQAFKSMELQMGKESANEWADLRGSTPLFGYPSVEEAEQILGEWLGIKPE